MTIFTRGQTVGLDSTDNNQTNIQVRTYFYILLFQILLGANSGKYTSSYLIILHICTECSSAKHSNSQCFIKH